jgi:hypothetical protein
VVGGRRLRGRTFVPAPVEGASITNGIPSAAYRTALQNAADNMIGDPDVDLVIWSRPRAADPEAVPPVAARAGSHAIVGSATTWAKWAVLRSRRD